MPITCSPIGNFSLGITPFWGLSMLFLTDQPHRGSMPFNRTTIVTFLVGTTSFFESAITPIKPFTATHRDMDKLVDRAD